MANTKCKPVLPFRPKMPTPLEVVKCNYCQKKKEKKEKKKGATVRFYSDSKCRIALYLNCKTKKRYFILPLKLSSHTLSFISLSSLLLLAFVLQLLSPLLKPKTPFFSNPKLRVVVVAAEVGMDPPI